MNNEIVLSGSGFRERWRLWGHPQGFGCDGCERAVHNNQLEPLLLHKIINGDVHGPLRSVLESIPADVLTAVQQLHQFPIELLQLAECNPPAFIRLEDRV